MFVQTTFRHWIDRLLQPMLPFVVRKSDLAPAESQSAGSIAGERRPLAFTCSTTNSIRKTEWSVMLHHAPFECQNCSITAITLLFFFFYFSSHKWTSRWFPHVPFLQMATRYVFIWHLCKILPAAQVTWMRAETPAGGGRTTSRHFFFLMWRTQARSTHTCSESRVSVGSHLALWSSYFSEFTFFSHRIWSGDSWSSCTSFFWELKAATAGGGRWLSTGLSRMTARTERAHAPGGRRGRFTDPPSPPAGPPSPLSSTRFWMTIRMRWGVSEWSGFVLKLGKVLWIDRGQKPYDYY